MRTTTGTGLFTEEQMSRPDILDDIPDDESAHTVAFCCPVFADTDLL